MSVSPLPIEWKQPKSVREQTQNWVLVWGVGRDGQLGLGKGEDMVQIPQTLQIPTSSPVDKVVQADCGYRHSAFLTEKGEVFCCGAGKYGRNGNGTEDPAFYPSPVSWGVYKPTIVQVACGFGHTLMLSREQQIWACGYGGDGALGLGTLENHKYPQQVKTLSDKRIVQVSAGGLHSMACGVDGAAYTWGLGNNGRLGLGDTETRTLPVRLDVPDGKAVKAVCAGFRASGVVTEAGDLYTAGSNSGAILGHSYRDVETTEFSAVEFPSSCSRENGQRVRIEHIALGGRVSGAITSDGDVILWGTVVGTEHSGLPRRCPTPEHWGRNTHISAGNHHISGCTENGVLWVVGSRMPMQQGGAAILGVDDNQAALEHRMDNRFIVKDPCEIAHGVSPAMGVYVAAGYAHTVGIMMHSNLKNDRRASSIKEKTKYRIGWISASGITNLAQFIQGGAPKIASQSGGGQEDMVTYQPAPLMSERLAQVRDAVGGFRLDNSRLDHALQNLGRICEELDTTASPMGELPGRTVGAPSHREEEIVHELTDHLSLGRADAASTITVLNMLRALSAHATYKELVQKELPTLMEVVWQRLDNPKVLLSGWELITSVNATGEGGPANVLWGARSCMADGGVDMLILALTQHLMHSSIQAQGLQLLADIACNSHEHAKAVIDGGGLHATLQALRMHPDNETVQVHGVRLLWEVGRDASKAVVSAGGLKATLNVARQYPDNPRILKFAFLALGCMGTAEREGRAIVKAEMAKAAVHAMPAHLADAEMQCCACYLLAVLVWSVGLGLHLPWADVRTTQQVVAALVKYPENVQVQELGLLLLGDLATCSVETCLEVVTMGGVQIAISAMRAFPHSENILGRAQRLLCLVAENVEDWYTLIVDAGAVEVLSPAHPNGLELLEMLVTRGSTEQNNEVTLAIIVEGHVQVLYHPPLLRHSAALRSMLEAQYPPSRLLPLMRTRGNHYLQLYAVVAFLYLTGLSTPDQRSQFVLCAGVDRLVHLLTSPEQALSKQGAQAIGYLCQRLGVRAGKDSMPLPALQPGGPEIHHFERILNDPDTSDVCFELRCGRRFYAHRVLLTESAATDIYQKMLRGNSMDAQPGSVIKVTDVSFEAFECTMRFLYAGRLTEKGKESEMDSALLAEIFMVAERYLIYTLQQTCATWLVQMFSKDELQGVWDALEIAMRSNMLPRNLNEQQGPSPSQILQEQCGLFLLQNTEAAIEDDFFVEHRDELGAFLHSHLEQVIVP